MANLAIKGHPTRGKEVIEILKMLGGKNNHFCYGNADDGYYAILGNDKEIHIVNPNCSGFYKLTLKEFLEKFPYKIGDKVQHKGATSCGSVFEVEKMRWEVDTVMYTLRLFGCNYKTSTLPAEYLQPYKEESMEEKTDKALAPDLRGEDYSNRRFGYKIPNGYEFECIRGNEIILKPIKPQYPKTYEECCKILNIPVNGDIVYAGNWTCWVGGGYLDKHLDTLRKFQQLLICHAAYWKVAGEELGLDEPWKPDWNDEKQDKYGFYNEVKYTIINPAIFVFPTEEMRDAFYENFKDLIEDCKQLL